MTKNDDKTSYFWNSIGEGIGCFLGIVGAGIAIALVMWAFRGFPGLN